MMTEQGETVRCEVVWTETRRFSADVEMPKDLYDDETPDAEERIEEWLIQSLNDGEFEGSEIPAGQDLDGHSYDYRIEFEDLSVGPGSEGA